MGIVREDLHLPWHPPVHVISQSLWGVEVMFLRGVYSRCTGELEDHAGSDGDVKGNKARGTGLHRSQATHHWAPFDHTNRDGEALAAWAAWVCVDTCPRPFYHSNAPTK